MSISPAALCFQGKSTFLKFQEIIIAGEIKRILKEIIHPWGNRHSTNKDEKFTSGCWLLALGLIGARQFW